MENLIHDFRFAFRQLRRDPGFSIVAILTLALGIGATAVVFSVFNAVVLRPLPFQDAGALVRIREVTPQGQLMSVSDPDFLDFRVQSRGFEEMAAVYLRPLILDTPGEPVRITSMAVTDGFFRMLAWEPLLGRSFVPDEHRRGGEPVAVLLSHEFWERQFGGDPDLVGRTIVLDGVARTVVGVLPESPGPPFQFDAWLPFAADPGFPRAEHRREVFARLSPGRTVEDAREELSRVQAELGEIYPESNGGWGASVVSLHDWVVGPDATRAAQVLLAAVGLLLLLACASVSNLLLARSMARRREISLRAALGAGRGRLLAQFMVEGGLLAGVGALLGLVLTVWVIPLIRSLSFSPLPRLDQVTVDWTVLGVAVAATGVSALIFGSAPALDGARVRLMTALRVGNPSADRAGRRVRAGLVVGQLALATMLLVGAGLLVNSFVRMSTVDPGFDTRGLLLVELSAPADRYPEMSEATYGLYRDLVEAVESVPGVLAAGATMASPLSDTRPSNFVARSDRASERSDFLQIRWRAVSSGLFDALGNPVLAGRSFTTADTDAAMEAAAAGGEVSVPVVLSRSLADRLWPEGNAVGRSVVWGEPGGAVMTVVGIVGDVRDLTFPWDPEPAVYLPHRMASWPTMTLVVRTDEAGAGVTRQIREAVWTVDGDLPIPDIQRMDETLGGALAGPRLNLILVGIFALSALLLAAVGLYGLTAFAVASRVREIGVRLALGAPRAGVLGLMVGQGLKLAVVGTSVGLLGAAAFTRFMENLLFGVGALNAPTFLGVALTLATVTLVAAYVPARRALKVDPASSLQSD